MHITSQEEGDRRGREKHTSLGGSSTERGDIGGHPPQEV